MGVIQVFCFGVAILHGVLEKKQTFSKFDTNNLEGKNYVPQKSI